MSGSAQDDWQDRRASPRCAYSATAIVYVGNEQLVCRAVDISSGGMLIIPPNRRERGSFLRVNLSLPSFDEVLDIDAIVVREAEVNGRYAWGVAFHEPDARVVKLLSAFVQWGLDRSRRVSEVAAPVAAPVVAPVGEVETRGASAAVGVAEERSDAAPAGGGRDTPTSLKAVDSGFAEFGKSETYGGDLAAEEPKPLPHWSEADNRELEQLFGAVLAELDEKP